MNEKPESYDDANARMSASMGPRTSITSVAGTIGNQGADSADEAEAQAVQAAARRLGQKEARLASEDSRDWKERWGVTFRSEPPDLLQFHHDESSGEVIIRVVEKPEDDPVSAASTPAHPFQLTGLIEGGAAKITVAYGTVIGGGVNLVPTIGGTSIAATPAPELTVVTGTVYLKATVDAAGTPTALVIENAASTPTDTSTLKHRTITDVTVTGTNVTVVSPQSVQTALNLFLCDGTAIWDRA